jgi:L-fuconolactonase
VTDARDQAPLIDTHLHQWDLAACEYAWITPAVGVLNRTHTLDEVEAERRAAGVTGAVLVQSANTRCDTDSMLAAMAVHPWVAGVVGWTDLTRGKAVEAEAAELAADPRIVGIRHLNHDEPDPDWLVRPDVLDGVRTLARLGLAFDVVAIWPLHLDHVSALAEAAPDLRIVVDHLAKPPIASGELSAWRQSMARAAAHPNVVAKVSGLDTAAGSPDWTPGTLRPAFETALELFGADRLMYGGDWPVSRLGGGYTRQHAAFEALTAPLSPDERAAISAGTATRVYALDRSRS